MNRTIPLVFSADELRMLAEALDSHLYWELTDESGRGQGFHGEPAATAEDGRADEYRRFAAMAARIEHALRQDSASGDRDK